MQMYNNGRKTILGKNIIDYASKLKLSTLKLFIWFIYARKLDVEKEVTQLVNTILTDYLEKDKIVSSKDIDNYLMNIKYNSNINQIFYSLMKIDIDYLKDVQFSHFKTENIKYF
jgi:hypothetical protein